MSHPELIGGILKSARKGCMHVIDMILAFCILKTNKIPTRLNTRMRHSQFDVATVRFLRDRNFVVQTWRLAPCQLDDQASAVRRLSAIARVGNNHAVTCNAFSRDTLRQWNIPCKSYSSSGMRFTMMKWSGLKARNSWVAGLRRYCSTSGISNGGYPQNGYGSKPQWFYS